MVRLLLNIIIILATWLNLSAQTTPMSMRLDYMLKQVNDNSADPALRIAWADSVIKHSSAIDDNSIIENVILKKAEISYDHAFYRKSLDAYLRWINDFGIESAVENRLKAFDKTAELYYYMGWYELSLRLSLDIIKTEKPETQRHFDCLAYQRMSHCHIRLRDIKYAKKYADMADSCMNLISIADSEMKDKVMFDMSILRAAVSMINADYNQTYGHLSEARKFARSERDSIAILGDEAIVYEAIGDNNISRQCYEKIIRFHDTSYQSIVCVNNYIYFLTRQRDYAKAHEICALSYKLLGEMELDHSKSNLLGLESDIYMNEHDFKNAYLSLRKSIEIKDSIFTPDRLSNIYGSTNVADSHNLSVVLANESRKSTILRIAGIVLLLVAICAIVMWIVNSLKLRKLKRESKSIEKKLRDEIVAKEEIIIDLNDRIDCKNREIESYVRNLGDDEVVNSNFNNLHCRLSAALVNVHSDLTKAEINIATFILMGIPTKDIADRLNLSVRTIENTKYRLYKKLNVSAAEVPEYLRRFI